MVSHRKAIASDLPPVDARLVVPETRYEMYDGELVYVPPADVPHGARHNKISTLVEMHAALEFEVVSDTLTRTSKTSDVAPDVSVLPRAPDPRTGRRQLPQLAFEVVSTESLAHACRKAATLTARGVRRVFAVDLAHARVLEWWRPLEIWRALDLAGYIEDPVFAVPLPLEALLHAAWTDDAAARALIGKGNPVIVAYRAEGKAEGRTEGKAEGRAEGRAEGKAEGRAEGKAEGRAEGALLAKADALLMVFAARGTALEPADRARIRDQTDPERLDRWLASALGGCDLAQVLAEQ